MEMRTLKVTLQTSWDENELLALVTEENGIVTIKYMDESARSLIESVWVGDRMYTPSDGKAYMRALERAFSVSSRIIIEEVQS